MLSHSITPVASTGYGGRASETSGLTSQPPSGHLTGCGASFGSPAGAPLSTHATIVSISACFSERSLLKCPYCGLASHGGILLALTAFLIALAQGRAF